jgi:hypothetical protein
LGKLSYQRSQEGGIDLDDFIREREIIKELQLINDAQFHFDSSSVQWWTLLAFLIVPWIIWIRVVDKHRIHQILLVGTLVISVTTLFDLIGYYFNFWDYPTEFIPLIPAALPFDLSMVPVPYMLLYQFCRSWKSYGMGLLCMAFIYAFIGEPFANWLLLVIYVKWSNIYSILYYILVGISVRAFVEKLNSLSTTSINKV